MEVVGGVSAVEGEEDVTDLVAHVEDRPVDIEDDAELIIWVGEAHPAAVIGEGAHPIALSAWHRCYRTVGGRCRQVERARAGGVFHASRVGVRVDMMVNGERSMAERCEKERVAVRTVERDQLCSL
jgi:hypothetical protein